MKTGKKHLGFRHKFMMTYNPTLSAKNHRKKLVRKLEEKQAKLERQLEVEKKKLEEEQRKLDNERKIFETERLKLAQGTTTPAEESVQFFIYLHESWAFGFVCMRISDFFENFIN